MVTFRGKTLRIIQTWHKALGSKTVSRPILIPYYVRFYLSYKKTKRNDYASVTV